MKFLIKESLKYGMRSRPVIKNEMEHVKYLYSLDSGSLKAYKEKVFLEIIKCAFKRSRFYQKVYGELGIGEGDITSVDDLKILPVITKDSIRYHSDSILTVPRLGVFSASTSGTSGSPLKVYHSYKALRLEQAYIWVRRLNYGFEFGQKLVSLRGNLGNKSISRYVPISNTLYLSSYLMRKETALEYFTAISKFSPIAIEAYPSSLFNLALLFKELELSIQIPLCFTSSETLYPFQRELIESVFGAKVYDRYGCTERTISLAQNVSFDGYFEEPGYSINEINEDHVVTTSLINSAFPLIRYRVDDVVVRGADGRVESIGGRNDDVVTCNDGVKIGRLDHIFKDVSGVASAQIVQHRIGEIDINIVPDKYFNANVFEEVLENLRTKVSEANLKGNIKIIDPDELIYSSRNKFSLVKSYVE